MANMALLHGEKSAFSWKIPLKTEKSELFWMTSTNMTVNSTRIERINPYQYLRILMKRDVDVDDQESVLEKMRRENDEEVFGKTEIHVGKFEKSLQEICQFQ